MALQVAFIDLASLWQHTHRQKTVGRSHQIGHIPFIRSNPTCCLIRILIFDLQLLKIIKQLLHVDLWPLVIHRHLRLGHAHGVGIHLLRLLGRLVQSQGSPQLLVLLDIAEEVLVIGIHLGLVRRLGQQIALVLGHALELPVPLPVLPAVGVVLLDQYHVGDRRPVRLGVLNRVKGIRVEIGPVEEIPHDRVAGVENVPHVCPRKVRPVVDAQVRRPGHRGLGEKPLALANTRRLNIHHDKFDHLRGTGQWRERCTPIQVGADLGGLESVGVEEVDRRADAVAQDQGRNVAGGLGDLERQGNQIVSTYWHDLDRVVELVRLVSGVGILRDEMLRLLGEGWHDRFEKVDKRHGLILVGKVKVDAVPLLLDVDGVPMGLVLQDQLFEEQECALVCDLLADLDGRSPDVGRVRLGALAALLVGDNIDHLETLLHEHAVGDRVLYCDLDLDSPRMGFCPDESGVCDADLAQVPQALEAERQQFSGFKGRADPGCGGLEPSVAVSAELEGAVAWYPGGDVDSGFDAENC